MLLPGIGEAFVPTRVRMMLALFLCLLLFPVLAPGVPAMPADVPGLARLIIFEALIGIFIGSLLRLLISAIETAGAIIGVQMGLSNAMILNPSMATQNTLSSAFLGMAGVTLLFLTGLDHLMLRGLVDLYRLFPPGQPFEVGDMAEAYTTMLSKSFTVGVEIAAPFLVVGLLLFVALGFMQRMVSQVQLFLVALPVQIAGGVLLFGLTMGVMLDVWLRFFDRSLADIIFR